jgi:hypothetical protein
MPATTAVRRRRRRISLSSTRVRYFRWLARRNSMAANFTRRWRSRLMRWMTTGAAASGSPHQSNG